MPGGGLGPLCAIPVMADRYRADSDTTMMPAAARSCPRIVDAPGPAADVDRVTAGPGMWCVATLLAVDDCLGRARLRSASCGDASAHGAGRGHRLHLRPGRHRGRHDRAGRGYRFDMAFVVKLSPADTEALREQAAREHRSMHEVAVLAIKERIDRNRRAVVLDALFDEVAVEDAELLDRLGR